jgi:hypothetical protein
MAHAHAQRHLVAGGRTRVLPDVPRSNTDIKVFIDQEDVTDRCIEASEPDVQLLDRPALPSLKQVIQFAAQSHRRVQLSVIRERNEICSKCEYAAQDPKTSRPWCTLCGCWVTGKPTDEFNLSAWEEYEGSGCHHPLRKEGRGWPINPSPLP